MKAACRWILLATATSLLSACGAPPSASDGVRVIGQPGRQPGQFSKPRGIAITKSGLLVVIDRTGRVILHDADSGEFVRQWRLQEWLNGTPTGVSIDPIDDTIWIADTHYHRVIQYDQEGNILTQFGEEGEGPGKFVFITDVCPDPDGETLWITDYGRRNRVIRFTRSGQFVAEWGTQVFETADLQRPMAALLSPDAQRLYIVDTGNCRINVYTRDGALLFSFGGPGNEPGRFNMPQDMALGPDGLLYIVEYSTCRVSRFTQDGRFVDTWGSPGNAPGQFFTPWGIAVGEDGRIVIADTMNHRLQLVRNVTEITWVRPANDVASIIVPGPHSPP
jgi:DNA-binding beta-propeller fold protein YncE